MRIIEELQALAMQEESLFRAQLLREDVVRLQRLQALAREASDSDAYRRAGLCLGWTQGDARTAELAHPLEHLLALVYRRVRGQRDDAVESEIRAAWTALYNARLERLVGCLATPVPKPRDD